jgi:DNA-binding transcriptional ArsR family regulator
MALLLRLDVADLAGTRFAISPLCETIKALQLLARPDPPEVNLPWVRWVRRQLDERPLRLPTLWPLAVTGLQTYPEFLIPAPASRWPALEDELARLAATPAEAVRASLRRVFADDPWPDSATDLFERPEQTLEQVTSELAECHDRLIAPHWDRIRAVLDADIGYRTALLASGGARDLFGDISSDLRWSQGVLTLADVETAQSSFWVQLGPGGLVIVPGVLNWPHVSVSRATSTQTVLVYPARGAATVWYALGEQAASGTTAEYVLGQTRARLLSALRSPATTTSLARQLGVTPSAVSQQLAFLYRGGLVDRQRSGRAVLYQTSELGQRLLVPLRGT